MKKVCLLLSLCFIYCFSFAQGTSGHSGTGSNINVVYHRFNWTINPDAAKNIAGTVTTYFKTTQNNVSSITFDLNKSSFNNASLKVKYHGSATGVSFSFPSSGNTNILIINLPVTLANGILDSVSIAYSGAPPAVNDQAEGFQNKVSGGDNYIYTLSESYEDKDWWPCKADMQDKIDSTDFVITTPSAFTAITNGVLVSNVVSGSNRIFTYKHRYPIASYLVSVAVAKYNVFNRGTVNIGGVDMPVEFSIFSSHGASPTTQLTAMDFCKQELVAFSSKYGDYAFKNEKYGMYEFGWGGGMEHQTNSAMSFGVMSNWGVIAHELAHQWFGDKVTFATWNHLWLAEGFASYSEALAAELVPGLGQSPSTVRGTFKTDANSTASRGYSCVIPDASITNSNVLWNSTYGNTVYQRGAMVVSMLRTLLGDTKFFQACRNYLSDPALSYKSAVTDDLRHHMEALAGPGAGTFDLTAFFNAFAYGSGFPTTVVNWGNPSGKILNVTIASQTRTSAGSTTYFPNVVPIRVQGAGGQDTTIVIYDADGNHLSKAGDGIGAPSAGNFLTYTLSFVPTTVTFDAFNTSLSKGSTFKTTVLDLRILDFSVKAKGPSNDALLVLDDNIHNSTITFERSADGISFNPIGTMVPQLSNTSEKSYFLKDASPLYGNNYYRANYKNAFGENVYSRIIKLNTEPPMNFSIINNPVQGTIRLRNSLGSLNKNYQFSIYDANGKLISSEQKRVSGDITALQTTGLAHAIYMLEVRSVSNELQTIRFIIQ